MKRQLKKGGLVRTAAHVSGYDPECCNQLAIIHNVARSASPFREVHYVVRLIHNNDKVILFDGEFTLPDEEQADEGR